jgi:hypothetical protein
MSDHCLVIILVRSLPILASCQDRTTEQANNDQSRYHVLLSWFGDITKNGWFIRVDELLGERLKKKTMAWNQSSPTHSQ